MGERIAEVLKKVGEMSLRSLWIHIHFGDGAEIPIDAFVQEIDRKVMSGEVSVRFNESGSALYSVAAGPTKTGLGGCDVVLRIKEILQVPRRQKETAALGGIAPTTMRPYLAILKELGVVRASTRELIYWDNEMEAIMRNIDQYIGTLSHYQEMESSDAFGQLNSQ